MVWYEQSFPPLPHLICGILLKKKEKKLEKERRKKSFRAYKKYKLWISSIRDFD